MVQVLKKYGYQKSIISNILQVINNNPSLSQSQKQTQATDIPEEEIRMSVNLPYVEGASEKQQQILRSHKIRSTLYTKHICEIYFVNPNIEQLQKITAISFMKSTVVTTKSRSVEHKISFWNCDCEKNEIGEHCWEADLE